MHNELTKYITWRMTTCTVICRAAVWPAASLAWSIDCETLPRLLCGDCDRGFAAVV